MAKDLHFEFTYPHPVERVWWAITDPEAVAEWLMPGDFRPRVGHSFTFRTEPQPGFDGIIHSEVLEVEAPRRLAFTWKTDVLDTVVTIRLEEVPEGTRLHLTHAGFRGVRGRLVARMLSGGWKSGILAKRLPALLQSGRGPGRPDHAQTGEDEG